MRQVPDSPALVNALAWSLATSPDRLLRDGDEAVRLATKACRLTEFSHPELLDTLAAAYARVGRYDEAVDTERKAIELAKQEGTTASLESFNARLALYEAGKPFAEE